VGEKVFPGVTVGVGGKVAEGVREGVAEGEDPGDTVALGEGGRQAVSSTLAA